jgi:hypothetical protein
VKDCRIDGILLLVDEVKAMYRLLATLKLNDSVCVVGVDDEQTRKNKRGLLNPPEGCTTANLLCQVLLHFFILRDLPCFRCNKFCGVRALTCNRDPP